MQSQKYYVGMDVHKLLVYYCVKQADGTVVAEGKVKATRIELLKWAQNLPQPSIAGLEATLFSHWIYYRMSALGEEVRMGHPARMRAITSGKKKNDRLDAATLADLLRANLFPAIHVLPEAYMRLRQALRYRNLLVRSHVRMKNKMAGLLMESGVEFETRKLHQKSYFAKVLKECQEMGQLPRLLKYSRRQLEIIQAQEREIEEELVAWPELQARLARLMAIRGVGRITALTWALEVGPVDRVPSISQAVSYCGLTSAQRSSAGVDKRGPLSKQRNRFLQTTLVEAAKIAPQWNPQLKQVQEKALARGHRNRATLAVARKLVAYLWAADHGHKPAAQPEVVQAADAV